MDVPCEPWRKLTPNWGRSQKPGSTISNSASCHWLGSPPNLINWVLLDRCFKKSNCHTIIQILHSRMRYNDIQYIYIQYIEQGRIHLQARAKLVPCSSSDLWPGDPCRIASWFKPPSLPCSIPNSSSIEPSLLATLHIPFFGLNHVKLWNKTYFSIYFVVFVSGPIFMADHPVLNCGETFPPLSIACILCLFGDHACGLGRPGSVDVFFTCRLDWAKQPMYDYIWGYVTIVIYLDICYIWGYVIIVIYVDIPYICGYI